MRFLEWFKTPKAEPKVLPLVCSICIFTDQPETPADTILNGNATCIPHLYIFRDPTHMKRVAFAKGEPIP